MGVEWAEYVEWVSVRKCGNGVGGAFKMVAL